MASREKGYLAAAATQQISCGLNLLKRTGDVESWLFPKEHMSRLSPGELSGAEDPAVGGGRGLCAARAGWQPSRRSDGKKEAFKRLKVAH